MCFFDIFYTLPPIFFFSLDFYNYKAHVRADLRLPTAAILTQPAETGNTRWKLGGRAFVDDLTPYLVPTPRFVPTRKYHPQGSMKSLPVPPRCVLVGFLDRLSGYQLRDPHGPTRSKRTWQVTGMNAKRYISPPS